MQDTLRIGQLFRKTNCEDKSYRSRNFQYTIFFRASWYKPVWAKSFSVIRLEKSAYEYYKNTAYVATIKFEKNYSGTYLFMPLEEFKEFNYFDDFIKSRKQYEQN